MGRHCILCGRERPNEQFGGGRGLRSVICRKCRQIPKDVRKRMLATDEVLGFLEQKNISKKNIKRLIELESIGEASFENLRSLVLEIAHAHPQKRQRWKNIRKTDRNLFDRIRDSKWFDWVFDSDDFQWDFDEFDDYELCEHEIDYINSLLIECEDRWLTC